MSEEMMEGLADMAMLGCFGDAGDMAAMGLDPFLIGALGGAPELPFLLGLDPAGACFNSDDDEEEYQEEPDEETSVDGKRNRRGVDDGKEAPAKSHRREVPSEAADGFCQVCNVQVPKGNEAQHNAGKKHHSHVEQQPQRQSPKSSGRKKNDTNEKKQGSHRDAVSPIVEVEIDSSAPLPLYSSESGDYSMTRGGEALKPGDVGYLQVTSDADFPTSDAPNIRMVKIVNHSNAISRAGLLRLAQHSGQHLAHVDLGGAAVAFNGADLIELARKCPYLEVLDIKGYDQDRHVTLTDVKKLFLLLPRLKYLDLRETSAGRILAGECPPNNFSTPKNVLVDL